MNDNQKPGRGRTVLWCILFVFFIPLSSLAATAVMIFIDFGSTSGTVIAGAAASYLLLTLLYFLFRKKLLPPLTPILGLITGLFVLTVTVLLVISKGNVEGTLVQGGMTFLTLLLPGFFLFMLMTPYDLLYLLPLLPFLAFLWSILFRKQFSAFRKAIPFLAALLVLAGISMGFYLNRPSKKYAGHGFKYMHGYSSTDFSDYMVYSDPSKLVALDEPASLRIENEAEMPKLDGAEACYPVYAAIAKAVYKDIDVIEKKALEAEGDKLWGNGKIVRFTNTVQGFRQLVYAEYDGSYNVDLLFSARPSKAQMEDAAEAGVPLEVTQIGREAFVFFVEPDNPVTSLTSDQIRRIYSGEITNWKDVGGKNQAIKAFQRPQNSGSQTIMQYFMVDVPLKEPDTYEVVGAMGGVVDEVAQYANEAGAFGYSFRYFVEDLMQENNVRVIAVDGIQPTIENIRNGSYPLTTGLCLITRKDDPNPNVQKMIDFILSEQGQEIIEKTGYAGVGE